MVWKNSTDVTHLRDDRHDTCVQFPSNNPTLLLLSFGPFSYVTLRVFVLNLHLENNGCESPLIVASHNSELHLGQAPCRPICNGLLRCLREETTRNHLSEFADFKCSCNQSICRGIIIAMQSSAVIDPAEEFKVCHIEVVP